MNGRIHTMDDRNSVVSSVVIRNNRFVQVGHGYDRHRDRDAKPRVIDLRGRTVVPGVVESHIHVVSLANRPGYHTPTRTAPRSRRCRRRSPRGGRTCRPASSSPRWAAGIRTCSPSTACRRARSSTRRCPTGRCCMYQNFTGPCATNSLGKAFFESAVVAARRPGGQVRDDGLSPPGCRRRRRCTTCGCGRRSRTRSGARSMR